MALINRNGIYYLRRRVPRRFKDVEKRSYVHLTLKTDSESEASARSDGVWSQMIEGWEARLAGNDTDAEKRFVAAKNIAQRLGFNYLPMADVVILPTEQFLQRVEAAGGRTNDKALVEAGAILGAVDRPNITVTQALEMFWGMSKDRILGQKCRSAAPMAKPAHQGHQELRQGDRR